MVKGAVDVKPYEIPAKGITAGDLALAQGMGRQEGPQELPEQANPPQEPAPAQPAQAFTPFEAMVVKRLDQQGELLIQLADKAFPSGPQAKAIVPQGSIAGIPSDIIAEGIKAIREALSGGSNQPGGFMFDLYKKAHENYDSKVLLPTFSKLAGVDARAATHVTG